MYNPISTVTRPKPKPSMALHFNILTIQSSSNTIRNNSSNKHSITVHNIIKNPVAIGVIINWFRNPFYKDNSAMS